MNLQEQHERYAQHLAGRPDGVLALLVQAREYIADALEAHEHSDGRQLLTEIDEAIAKEQGAS
jgi:hypothetical protein